MVKFYFLFLLTILDIINVQIVTLGLEIVAEFKMQGIGPEKYELFKV